MSRRRSHAGRSADRQFRRLHREQLGPVRMAAAVALAVAVVVGVRLVWPEAVLPTLAAGVVLLLALRRMSRNWSLTATLAVVAVWLVAAIPVAQGLLGLEAGWLTAFVVLPTAWLAWELRWGRPWVTTALTGTAYTAGGLLSRLAGSEAVTQVVALLAAATMLSVRAGLPDRLVGLARDPGSVLRPRADIERWRQGASAERLTAELLAGLDRRFFAAHDLTVPGHGTANIDHVVIGPTGAFLVDTKAWRRPVTAKVSDDGDEEGQDGDNGMWFYAGKPLPEHANSARWEARELGDALGVPVRVVLCPHADNGLPADSASWGPVTVVAPTALVGYLAGGPDRLDEAEVRRLAGRLRQVTGQAGDRHQRAAVTRASDREPVRQNRQPSPGPRIPGG